MDKVKFLKWVEEKTNKILIDTPQKFIDDTETKEFLQGCVTVLDEIKLQVKNGKFD